MSEKKNIKSMQSLLSSEGDLIRYNSDAEPDGLKKIKESLLELYFNIRMIENKTDEDIVKEKEMMEEQKVSNLDLIEYIKESFEILVKMNIEANDRSKKLISTEPCINCKDKMKSEALTLDSPLRYKK